MAWIGLEAISSITCIKFIAVEYAVLSIAYTTYNYITQTVVANLLSLVLRFEEYSLGTEVSSYFSPQLGFLEWEKCAKL
jgi:hypothetical protein